MFKGKKTKYIRKCRRCGQRFTTRQKNRWVCFRCWGKR